ncbi:MAG: L,D-transpeptidase family protein [Clostridia bacterium]|nr:L,D-transpeptidase family protein [Clostridia bacterium]
MKKSSFIITEIALAAVFAVSAVTVGFFASDIINNGKTAEPIKSESSVQESTKPESTEQSSKSESSVQETSKKAESSAEESPEESKSSSSLKLQLTPPENLSSQPEELTTYISNYGYFYDNMNFDHLIVVDTNDSKGTVYCYQQAENGYWWNIAGDGKPLTDKCYIGENGADFVVTENSKKTPLGFYQLGEGFYIDDKPSTSYPMFRITEDTYWVDDPKSVYYNQKVEGTEKKDWESAEHMISETDAYKYGIVINYNTDPVVANAGSAMFMHCKNSATSGCVAVPEDIMKTILEWLDKDSNAYIFITL